MNETHEHRIKRLRLRSWRRGIKEMDLILGRFADEALADLSVPELDAHEAMMAEHDQDLYLWYSGQAEVPVEISAALQRVKAHFEIKKL